MTPEREGRATRTPQWEASRALDAEIAEKVMGGVWVPNTGCAGHAWLQVGSLTVMERGYPRKSSREVWDTCPRYSTDIAAAWLMVEKMRETGRYFHLEFSTIRGDWRCEFGTEPDIDRTARTAPLAICLAALAALSATPQDHTR